MLGTVLRQQGELQEAEKSLRRAIELRPDDPGPYTQLAQVFRSEGKAEESKQMFAMAADRKAQKEALQKEMFDRGMQARPKQVQ